LKQWPWYMEALRGLVVVLAWAGVMYLPGLLGLIRRKGDTPISPTT
jgi:hypothetical protein